MTSRLKFTLAVSLLFVALLFTAHAQQSTASATPSVATDAQQMQVLIEEVRQVRAVVERANLNTQRASFNLYYAQTLYDRLTRQQARVDRLTSEVEEVKTRIHQSLDGSRDEEELKELRATIDGAPNPQARAELIQSYQMTERSLIRQRELARQEADRDRLRQQQLETALHTEQARLSELQGQLDLLDREFEQAITSTKKTK